MSLRIILAIIAIAGMSIFGFLSSVASQQMVDEVNPLLPKERRFSPLGWWIGKTLRLHGEYRRLYPDGKLLTRYWTVTSLGGACLLLLVLAALFL